MNKSTNALTVAVLFAVAGWLLFLQKSMKDGTDSAESAEDTSPDISIQSEAEPASDQTAQISAEELAQLERDKEEAIRMAKLQMEQAKAEQERRIAEVQARLAKEEAARAKAEQQARETHARLDALAASLEEAKSRQAQLASRSAEESKELEAEMAAANDAIDKAKREAEELRRRGEELEQRRLVAVAEQERIEAELRAELEKYKRIEDWDYSYPVLPDQFKRATHIEVQAKMKANPNR